MTNNMNNKIKHLEMIESIIERMARNSFQLKGWSVTLIGIIGMLASQGSDKRFFLLVFIPLIAFYLLDAYYFQLEQKYQILYKTVSEKDEDKIDFSMDVSEFKQVCYSKCLLSLTEIMFYGAICGAVIVLAVVLFWD